MFTLGARWIQHLQILCGYGASPNTTRWVRRRHDVFRINKFSVQPHFAHVPNAQQRACPSPNRPPFSIITTGKEIKVDKDGNQSAKPDHCNTVGYPLSVAAPIVFVSDAWQEDQRSNICEIVHWRKPANRVICEPNLVTTNTRVCATLAQR